ncbi:hypothetical protein GCM10028805_53810 [Spirosoma harenae]
MILQDAITLLQSNKLIATSSTVWADLGCGTGLFTHALASLQPSGSQIYAVDTNLASLQQITDYQDVVITKICQDFVQDEWPFDTVDGILMANSLHYVQNKKSFLEKAARHLTTSGCFLLVEYDTNMANPWVPYPISFASLHQLFREAGYSIIEKLHQKSSIYGRANLYSAYVSR